MKTTQSQFKIKQDTESVISKLNETNDYFSIHIDLDDIKKTEQFRQSLLQIDKVVNLLNESEQKELSIK